jgi:hypothetical protein
VACQFVCLDRSHNSAVSTGGTTGKLVSQVSDRVIGRLGRAARSRSRFRRRRAWKSGVVSRIPAGWTMARGTRGGRWAATLGAEGVGAPGAWPRTP